MRYQSSSVDLILLKGAGEMGNITLIHGFDEYDSFAEIYNTYRPHSPSLLLHTLVRIAAMEKPQLVVDLGCGTGHSTFPWTDIAQRVVGIEPNSDFRYVAEQTKAKSEMYENAEFHACDSSCIALPDRSVDIATCAQSLHWMEPDSTLREVKRILRPGGVFATYDYLLPPTFNWKVERAFENFVNCVNMWEKELGQCVFGSFRWKAKEFLDKMRACEQFQYVREFNIHDTARADCKGVIGLALAYGDIEAILRAGVTASELGLDQLIDVAEHMMGAETAELLFSYVIRVGIA